MEVGSRQNEVQTQKNHRILEHALKRPTSVKLRRLITSSLNDAPKQGRSHAVWGPEHKPIQGSTPSQTVPSLFSLLLPKRINFDTSISAGWHHHAAKSAECVKTLNAQM